MERRGDGGMDCRSPEMRTLESDRQRFGEREAETNRDKKGNNWDSEVTTVSKGKKKG